MKVSVIVPVYNAEKFVAKCIDSIQAQTYRDWELLLIDDGSVDHSLDILRQYASEDVRIRVFHQQNSGAGMARNVGIKNASGDYLVFVDSDDTVESDYFEKLAQKDTDIVFIDVNQRDEADQITKCERLSVNQGKSKEDILRGQMTGKILWGGVRKAVKLDLIRRNNIYYTNHQVGEEAIYSFLLLWHARDFSFLDTPVYNYVQNTDSLSHQLLDDPYGGVAVALKEKVIALNAYEKYADTVNAFILTAAAVSLDKMAQKYPLEAYREKAKERISRMRRELDAAYPIDYRHMDKKAVMLSPFLKCGVTMPVYFISKMRKLVRAL